MPRIGITAYDLLISCPGDVDEFIEIIQECTNSFNTIFGALNNSEIVTKHWSTASYPQSGGKPQELLNDQFIRNCDAAVAIFWTRFGSPTDKYGSGTEEEIEEMLAANKQVFMYFLDAPTTPSSVNMEQYKKIENFREKYKDKGIYCVVKNKDELRKEFTNHLAMHFLPLVIGTKETIENKLSPMLEVRDISLRNNAKINIKHTLFLECPLIKEKCNMIISQIASLQQNFLPKRQKEYISNQNNKEFNNPELQKILESTRDSSSIVSNADIPDEWEITINTFALDKSIKIEDKFWNTGNLKKRVSSLTSFFRNEPSFEGEEAEKKRYKDLQELYHNILEYNEYIRYFSEIDRYAYIELIVENTGNTFDEDIDVKLTVKKDCIYPSNKFSIPGINIINDILNVNFVEHVYKVKITDAILKYKEYPMSSQTINLSNTLPFDIRSTQEKYTSNKKNYTDNLADIFCYNCYKNDENDVYVFHINYLKHNTAIAFPSVLVLKNIPDIIEYEISSKYIPNIIQGKLEIEKEC